MNTMDIYFSPAKYFTALKEKPKWLIPLIAIIVVSIIMTVVVMMSFGPEKRMQQLRDQNLTPEQMERAQKMMNGPIPMISGIAAAIILTPVMLLLIALIFNFTLPLLSISAKYMITFCTVCGAALIRIPSMLVKTILTVIKGSPYVHTSFALFFPMVGKNTFFFRLMSKLDFFTIWEMFVLALGLQIIYSIPNKKSYYLVFGLWLAFVLLTSIFGFRGPTR